MERAARGSANLSAMTILPRALFCLALILSEGAGAKLLRHASQVDPGTMDPHSIATLYNNRVLSQIYETLVGRDEALRSRAVQETVRALNDAATADDWFIPPFPVPSTSGS